MTANFTGTQPNINQALATSAAYGNFNRLYFAAITASTTLATTTSGRVTVQRLNISPQIPSLGSGVQGFIASNISMYNDDAFTGMIVGIEYLLGSLNVGTGVFTDGVTMPTKTVRGAAIQTAAGLAFATIRTTLNAATPTLTVTFTDETGTTGQTCQVGLPTNSLANSGFFLQPTFTTGSIGIRDVTGMTISAGSAGVIDIYGVLPLYMGFTNTSLHSTNLLSNFNVPYLIEASEQIGFYRLFNQTTCDAVITMTLIPEAS